MPLSRLENFLVNTNGNILYVNPLLTEYEGNDRYDYTDPNFNENSEISVEDRNNNDPKYNFPRNTITS